MSNKYNKGKRYTPREQKEVVDFVVKYNEENGRGGVTHASKKFKVTPITINNWLSKAGVSSKPDKKALVGSGKSASSNVWSKLGELHDHKSSLEKELASVEKEIKALKKKVGI